MRSQEHGHVRLHQFKLFESNDALLAGYTDRAGGVSEAPYDRLNLGYHVGDNVEAVRENRRRLADAAGLEISSFVFSSQVHNGRAAIVTAADRGRGAFGSEDAIPHTDGLVTRDSNVVLAVMLADCVPVVLYDPATRAVGIAHAGWGGTVHHITRNTIETMRQEFGTDPGGILAGVGPSIGPTSYEVGPEVAERAEAEFPTSTVLRSKGDGKFVLDLWSSNVADLLNAGVRRTNIELVGLDTYEAFAVFFSDRRQRPTGRFVTLVALPA